MPKTQLHLLLPSAGDSKGRDGDQAQLVPDVDEDVRTTKYNDINLKRWRDYDHIITDSLWIIGARDKEGGHQLDYHGNFIPQIATQAILRYTKEDDIVLDLFLGSGTTAIESLRRGRKCIGVELKQTLVDYVKGKIPPEHLNRSIFILQGDSTTRKTKNKVEETIASLGRESAHLLILHPPYHDIIKFSDLRQGLSNAPSLQDFLRLFSRVAKNGYDLLLPGRFAALIIGDKYEHGELVPLGFYCMDAMKDLGFRIKAIVVKNITGNERGKGKDGNLWRYRALAGGFYIFKHEYVMIFQKPGKKRHTSQQRRT